MNKGVKKILIAIVMVGIGFAVVSQIQKNVERTYAIENRDAAMKTVNGGNYEYAMQEAVKSGGKLVNGIFLGLYLLMGASGCIYIYKSGKKMAEEIDAEDKLANE